MFFSSPMVMTGCYRSNGSSVTEKGIDPSLSQMATDTIHSHPPTALWPYRGLVSQSTIWVLNLTIKTGARIRRHARAIESEMPKIRKCEDSAHLRGQETPVANLATPPSCPNNMYYPYITPKLLRLKSDQLSQVSTKQTED